MALFKRSQMALFYRSVPHPNIVKALDADEVDGKLLFVMEYVEGGIDLAKLVKTWGPLAIEQACDFIRQTALGLQHAHNRGLVHRDIKPANLLLMTQEWVIKILDMGLARLNGPLEGETSGTLTQQGAVMGTPDYIAPEQARNSHTVDSRSDLYSLGCTFYYLLTGKPPFPGGTLAAKLIKHQRFEPVPIEQLRPEVPTRVAEVVYKLMAKRLEARFQSAAEVATRLGQPGRKREREKQVVFTENPGVKSPDFSIGNQITVAPPSQKRQTLLDLERGQSSSKETPIGKNPLPVSYSSRGKWLRTMGLVLAVAVMIFLFGSPPSKEISQQDEPGSVKVDIEAGPSLSKRSRNRDPVPVRPPEPVILRLTDGGFDQSRSAFFTTAVNVRAFTTEFTFRIARESNAADGFTFCIQGNDATCLGVWGWGLGYVRIGKSVAIKFDLGDNGRWQGINSTGLFTNGAPPVGAASVPFGYGIDLHSGNTYKTLLSYDRKSLTLKVTDAADPFKTFSKTFDALDIPNLVGGPTAFVGFTGATSGAGAIQDILDWTWSAAGASAGMAQPNYAKGFTSLDLTLNGRAELVHATADREERDIQAKAVGEIRRLFGHEGIIGIALSPADHHVMAMNRDGTVAWWDWDCGLELGHQPAQGHQGTIASLAFSPDGTEVVSSGADATVRLWDMEISKEIRTFEGHGGGVCCALFSPDGRQILSGSEDKSARLWDVREGKTIRSFQGHSEAVKSVAFSPDGKQVLTASADRTIRLWDVATGRELQDFEGHAGPVNGVVFTPQGDRVLSCSDDKTLRL